MATAVLWDVDGTLAGSEPFHLASLIENARDHGIELPESFHTEMIGRTARETYTLIVERYGLKVPFEPWIAAKYLRYVAQGAQIPARPGAVEAYTALKDRGVPQALVSNSDRIVVDTNIRALGLTRPQLVTVALNDVRRGKPDPEPYLRAAYLLGVEPDACLVVEDSGTGALAGVRAGMTVLAWPELPDMRFPDGVELVDDLAAALARHGLIVE